MLKRRIIPCLDVSAGRTVKGTQFIRLRDAGDPVELAVRHCEGGADELVLLDISATVEGRGTMLDVVEAIAASTCIPFTVGGGIRSVSDVGSLLERGADKISVNSAAVRSPSLIEELAREFGSQSVVLAIDAREGAVGWEVMLDGGRTPTGREPIEWAREGIDRGAGEILLTSMDHDGSRNGFAVELTRRASELPVPVIASGGAGTADHFLRVFNEAHADAALAAGIFHSGELSIRDLKRFLIEEGVPIRAE